VLATNPAPRAFLVYAAEVSDYGAILKRLAGGFDIHQCALLEEPLAAPLPGVSALPGTPASIRRFEPNSLWVHVDAATIALLVLADIALGLLGRLNAQLQLLTLAFPLKMMGALALLGWIAAVLPRLMAAYSGAVFGTLRQVLRF